MTLDELDAAREWMLLLGRKTAREKIASLLAIIARRDASLKLRDASGPLVFDLPLTRTDIADFLGLTIETVSRQLSKLRADRVVIIEDTRELQCAAPNLVAMRTKDGVATLSELVRSSLRLRPDRIPIGEVRGAEALDLLKAWGTGHPGGIGTIHAGSGIGALRRLEQLIQEAVVTVPRAMIAETIDLVAVLTGRGSARRLVELARVDGLGPDGDYRIFPAFSEPGTTRNTGEPA